MNESKWTEVDIDLEAGASLVALFLGSPCVGSLAQLYILKK